ncbi:MAG: hypothetical protein M3Y87_19540 [Myxococcota bacterium]|nr:hypothetical protein [Myxococcota bacterium]
MRAALFAIAAIAVMLPAAVRAQESPRGVIVLVLDRGSARVDGEELGRAIAHAVARDVVRITDDRARDATGTLTIAHDAGTRWHVRFESRGRSASVVERVRPRALDAMLADASLRVLTDVESAPEPVTAGPGRAGYDRSLMYVVWTDEILDPFVDAPSPPRRELAIFSEVIDPFAPAASRRGPFAEVLDPWGH